MGCHKVILAKECTVHIPTNLSANLVSSLDLDHTLFRSAKTRQISLGTSGSAAVELILTAEETEERGGEGLKSMRRELLFYFSVHLCGLFGARF